MAFEDTIGGFILLITGLILGNMYAKLKIILSEYKIDKLFERVREERSKEKGVAE